MGNTITIRLDEDLSKWLRETSKKTGLPIGRLVRDHLRSLKENQDEKPYMRLSGKLKGLPRDLSMREGFGPR